MIFTTLEKNIIKSIASQNITEIKPFGYTARSLLFPKTEGAVFIPEDVLTGKDYHPVLYLLARHDGGKTHSLMREQVVSFVSLIKYLEDERLVYIMDGPENKPCLYYEGYQHINIAEKPIKSSPRGDATINYYQAKIEEGIEFNYQSFVREGYNRH